MNDEIKKVLFEMAASHAILSQAEYGRNSCYNDHHFSAIAENNFIALINRYNLMHEFLGYCTQYDKKNRHDSYSIIKHFPGARTI